MGHQNLYQQLYRLEQINQNPVPSKVKVEKLNQKPKIKILKKALLKLRMRTLIKVKELEKTTKKKSKRKRKRKNHDQDSSRNNNSGAGDLLSVLQIMPRTEWKRLRNKYLNLQRKNMAHSKMRLKQFHERRKGTPSRGLDEDTEEGVDGEVEEKQLEFTPGIIVKFLVEEPIDDEKTVK